jgi:hypothetical protein
MPLTAREVDWSRGRKYADLFLYSEYLSNNVLYTYNFRVWDWTQNWRTCSVKKKKKNFTKSKELKSRCNLPKSSKEDYGFKRAVLSIIIIIIIIIIIVIVVVVIVVVAQWETEIQPY